MEIVASCGDKYLQNVKETINNNMIYYDVLNLFQTTTQFAFNSMKFY